MSQIESTIDVEIKDVNVLSADNPLKNLEHDQYTTSQKCKVKAYESSAKITSKGIEIPDWLLEILPSNQEVKVIILVKNKQITQSKQIGLS